MDCFTGRTIGLCSCFESFILQGQSDLAASGGGTFANWLDYLEESYWKTRYLEVLNLSTAMGDDFCFASLRGVS